MNPDGETFVWRGSLLIYGTCENQVKCVNGMVQPGPGKFVARMCAKKRDTTSTENLCVPQDTPTCVEVPFDYPTSTTVEGVLP